MVIMIVIIMDNDTWRYGCCMQYAGINIGPVHKRDVMKASVMLEHDPQ